MITVKAVQICQPRTASQSWNTDNWCWLDWVAVSLVGLLALMVIALLVILARIAWDVL